MKTKNSLALHYAHELYGSQWYSMLDKKEIRLTWGQYLKRGWYFVTFRNWLSNGIVTFSFFKHDGSVREAHGTTMLTLLPEHKRPKGILPRQGMSFSSISFFDLDKGEWRSFDIRNFIGFDTVYQLSQLKKVS